MFFDKISKDIKFKLFLSKDFDKRINLNINKIFIDSLLLKIPFKTKKFILVSNYIDYVLDSKPKEAADLYYELKYNYFIFVCRNLATCKSCLRSFIRGSERYVLLSTSTSKRLNKTGFSSNDDIDIVKWMLEDTSDIRSSNALDVAVNEYDIRGLDLDYGIIGWDLDLRRVKDKWDYYSFFGSIWKHVRK